MVKMEDEQKTTERWIANVYLGHPEIKFRNVFISSLYRICESMEDLYLLNWLVDSAIRLGISVMIQVALDDD